YDGLARPAGQKWRWRADIPVWRRRSGRMSSLITVGAQWGDEGKGKIVDLLSEKFDIVDRYQGGHNAGHTVEIGKKQFILQVVPCGILRENKKAVIGNGVVVDPAALLREIELLEKNGIQVDGRR